MIVNWKREVAMWEERERKREQREDEKEEVEVGGILPFKGTGMMPSTRSPRGTARSA